MRLSGYVTKVERERYLEVEVRNGAGHYLGYASSEYVTVTVVLEHLNTNYGGIAGGAGGELIVPWLAKEQPQVGTPIEVEVGIAPSRLTTRDLADIANDRVVGS